MDGFTPSHEDPLFADNYDSDNSYQADELPDHEPDRVEQQNPLGAWNPRVAVSQHAMDLAELEVQAAAANPNPPQRGTNGPKSSAFTIPKEFHNGPWKEIFPNQIRPTSPRRAHRPSEIDWDGWNLASDKPGTGHSARAFLTWAQKNPRRCTNAECQFAHTGAVGSSIISRHNPHDFWDPKWTLRTGIGTALPGYNHAATMSAVDRQEEEELRREIAMMHQENQPMYGDSGNDTHHKSNHSRSDCSATAVDSRDMFSPTAESSKIPMKRKRDTPQNVLCNVDAMDIDTDGEMEMTRDGHKGKGKDKGKGKAKEEPPSRAKSKSKTLLPPADIKRSVKRHLNFEAYRTAAKGTTGIHSRGHRQGHQMNYPGTGRSQGMPASSAGVKRKFSQTSIRSGISMGLDDEDDPFW